MEILPDQLNYWFLALLFIIGAGAYIISTIGGGGGSLILVPVVDLLLGAKGTAPVLNLGAMIGRPSRLILFWKQIKWRIVLFYAPAALAGAFMGGLVFEGLKITWLQIVIALFLISTLFQYKFGKKARAFKMKNIYFLPLGLGVAFVSTLTGAMGPVLNPFYLNAGIQKEEMIATKTANSFFMGAVQIGTYSFFGSLHGNLWVYGIALGLGATFGNILGKKVLSKMTELSFRKWVIGIMVISGVIMLIRQLMLILQ